MACARVYSRCGNISRKLKRSINNFEFEVINSEVIFTISANRFLRNMVRAIIGTILDVGLHKISLEELKEIIDKSERIHAGPSVPAHGLFLTKVEYPENIFLNE